LFNKLSLNILKSLILLSFYKIILLVRKNSADIAILVLLDISNKYLLFVIYYYYSLNN